MKYNTAVVFDNSGTLLHMYRVAKELKTEKYIKNIETTELVLEKKERALVIISVDPLLVTKTSSSKLLQEFIKENGLKIDIICSNGAINKNDVELIIYEENVNIGNLKEVIKYTKKSNPENHYLTVGLIVDKKTQSISYLLSTTGKLYYNAIKTIEALHAQNIDTYIASGDSIRVLKDVAYELKIPLENVFEKATPHQKANIILTLKNRYEKVIMVGDGINDIAAFKTADISILTLQQGNIKSEKLIKNADYVVNDLLQITKIINKG